ncbi:membrane-bound metallopeptidase [Sutterella sp. CAG:521]|nr:membrane-bound metallopeptidase [Sutterella sp. CAG:521]
MLPPYYLVFQLEQLAISDRFRRESYLSLLKNAIAVMEYSQKNFEYLQSYGIKNCFYVPIFSKVHHLPNQEPLHDVLFYGSTSSEHRQEFLNKLKKDFNIHIAKSISGEQTIEAIHNSKVIVNLHNYDNALLESTRIFECLSAGAVIVSEDGNDQNEYDYLSDFVDFVKSNNYDQLRSKISERLSNDNYKTQRIFIRDQLEKQFDRFGFGFSRMLLALGYISFDTFCKTWITKCLPPPKEGYVSIRNEKQINFSENFTFCSLRHRSKWIENELNTKFLCLLAKQYDLPCLTIDLNGTHSKEFLKQLSQSFSNQRIDQPILYSEIVFIPKSAYSQIIFWNELPRIVNSDKYSLWDNFEKVDQGTIKEITDSPCLKD